METLLFQDVQGLSSGENTFRMGDKWYGKVKAGDRVLLATVDENGKNEEVVGMAILEEVHVGIAALMLSDHAGKNHGVTQFGPSRRIGELTALLEKIYGVTSISNPITVIYFGKVILG